MVLDPECNPLRLRSGRVAPVAGGNIAARILGPQHLPLALRVVGHDRAGHIEDGLGGTVVLLQLDDPGAGEISFEVQDVLDVGAAEFVDRLILIPDDKYILMLRGKEMQQIVLGAVGVLVLVDQNESVLVAVVVAHLGKTIQDLHRLQEQIVKIQGIRLAQSLVIGCVKVLQDLGRQPKGNGGQTRRPGCCDFWRS